MKCDIELRDSMATEFFLIDIDPFSPQTPQEYSILELAHAVKNVSLTFNEPLPLHIFFGKNHRASCDPLSDLKVQVDYLVRSCKGLDLSCFREE